MLLLLCLSLLPLYLQHLVLDAALAPKVSTWHTGILCPFLDLDALHVVIAAIESGFWQGSGITSYS